MREDVFVSVDIEADGPIPGDYSMLSLGAAVVGRPDLTFYREIQPISRQFVPEALAVSGLDRDKLAEDGADPRTAMEELAAFLAGASRGTRPVFVGFNATFDWMFVNWYFIHFTGKNPFGISGLDIKAYYMGALGKRRWAETTKRHFDKRFLSAAPHTHNALEDAIEQAEIFQKLRIYVLGQGELSKDSPESSP
jgi:DNA polymerase III epsilon subunit-like protein